jgi:hypothetical protein
MNWFRRKTMIRPVTLLAVTVLVTLVWQYFGTRTVAATSTAKWGTTAATQNVPVSTDRFWCPSAVCHNSALCRPCDRRFLILICTGRSASTTLMNMMDSLPGIRVSGENNNVLMRLHELIVEDTLEFPGFKSGHKKPDSPWHHNPIVKGSHACVAQTMIQVINPPPVIMETTTSIRTSTSTSDTAATRTRTTTETIADDGDGMTTILGFKTIRFTNDGVNLTAAVEFVKESLPCARILINIRANTTAQVLSRKKSFSKELKVKNLERQVEQQNRDMRQVANLFGPDRAMLLDSSTWTQDISHLNAAVRWLGFSKGCFFDELLQLNTAGRGYSRTGKSNLEAPSPNCRYLGEEW